jgi:hypothetical protein
MLQKLPRFAGAAVVIVSVLSATLGGIKPLAASEGADVARAGTLSAQQSQSGSTFTFEQFYRGTDNALKEFAAARSDHAAIALDIGRCYKEIGDPIQWSPTVRAILLFELDEHLMHSLSYKVGNVTTGGSPGQILPTLNRFHAAAISFSDRVSRNRLEFRRELEDSRLTSRVYQYLILGLGTAATIFVSIRAMMTVNTVLSSAVGVFAIVLSAGAAAVSSMNTFEGSQATVLRDQRALSQLQQLHWRIASDVLKRSSICTHTETPPGEEMNVVDAWRSRLEAILDTAMESISRPGDISSGGSSPSSGHTPVQDVHAEGNAPRNDQAGG